MARGSDGEGLRTCFLRLPYNSRQNQYTADQKVWHAVLITSSFDDEIAVYLTLTNHRASEF